MNRGDIAQLAAEIIKGMIDGLGKDYGAVELISPARELIEGTGDFETALERLREAADLEERWLPVVEQLERLLATKPAEPDDNLWKNTAHGAARAYALYDNVTYSQPDIAGANEAQVAMEMLTKGFYPQALGLLAPLPRNEEAWQRVVDELARIGKTDTQLAEEDDS